MITSCDSIGRVRFFVLAARKKKVPDSHKDNYRMHKLLLHYLMKKSRMNIPILYWINYMKYKCKKQQQQKKPNKQTQKLILLILLFCFLFVFTGEAGDDQPFVSNNEKAAQYDPNLYLYSVSCWNWFRMQSELFNVMHRASCKTIVGHRLTAYITPHPWIRWLSAVESLRVNQNIFERHSNECISKVCAPPICQAFAAWSFRMWPEGYACHVLR